MKPKSKTNVKRKAIKHSNSSNRFNLTKLTKLKAQVFNLQKELQETKYTLQAIRNGEIDALVVNTPSGRDQIYTLKTVDYPYRTLIEAIQEGAIVFNSEKTITYANKSFSKLVKMPLEKIIGHSFYQYTSLSDRAYFNKFISQKKIGKSWEGIITLDNGVHFPVYFSLSKVKLDEEDSFCLIITDLTKQKEEEARVHLFREIEQQRNLYVTTLLSIEDGVIVTDTEAMITFINLTAEKMIGHRQNQVLGQSVSKFFKIIEKETRKEIENPVLKVLRRENIDKSSNHPTLLICYDGKEFPIDYSCSPVVNNSNISGVVLVFRDISERWKKDNEIRENENRLRMSLSAAQAGMWEWNLPSNSLTWSEEIWKLYGIEYNSVEPSFQSWFDRVDPSDVEKIKKGLKAAENDDQEFELEWKVKGPPRWLSTRGKAIRNSKGKLIKLMGIVIDITERKKIESAIIRSNQELEQLSCMVSHDIRGPLAVLRGLTQIVMEDHFNSNEKAKEYLLQIITGIDKIYQIIESILTLTRTSKQEIKIEYLDLSKMVKETLEELQRPWNRKAEIVIESNIYAFADPGLMRIALQNLLSNAWKFTSKREVTKIEFGSKINDGKNVFYIRDNGIGINMKFAEKIFDPFRQVHSEKEFIGTGIGLSIVRRVIDRHGGRIWVESNPEEGTTFLFTLS